MKRHLLTILAALCAVALFVPTSRAQDCYGSGYGGCGWGYGLLYNTLDYRVPYFAAHPPVYYSYPVPRPYGYSPFAYPPNVMTPEVLGAVEPAMIENPYVPSSQKTSEQPLDRVTSQRQVQPLVIVNPYVTSERSLASSER